MNEQDGRWPIKNEYRDAVIKRMVRIVADPNSTPSEASAASKVILQAEAQNQKDERDNDPSRRLAGLLEIAQQLGTFRAAPETIEGRATSRPDEPD